jgi:hypothetical protein
MVEKRSILENIVIVAILLVLVQTFLEDYAVIAGWSWNVRRVLLFTGFGFDIFFTIEFLTRLYGAFINRHASRYFWHERGWIDLLASIPLLLLNSGPAVLAYLSGSATIIGFGAILNVLKVVKAIRIARILRLLRVLKIFARIRNTDSVMAQRHVAKILTVAVSTIVVAVLVLTVLFSVFNAPSLEVAYQQRTLRTLERIDEVSANPAVLSQVTEIDRSILLVQKEGRALYSRFDQAYYDSAFGPGDYGFGEQGEFRVFFDLRPVNQEQSRVNLVYFGVIVFIVLAFMLYYSPHFALTVSDPVHIMSRGMNEKGYNLEIRVPSLYRDDEVYRLARLYNEVYLPLKDRNADSENPVAVDLKLDDIKDILGE